MFQSFGPAGRLPDEPFDCRNARLDLDETLILDPAGKVGQFHEGVKARLGIWHLPQQGVFFAFLLEILELLEKPAHLLCPGHRDPRSLENDREVFADRPQIALQLEDPPYAVWVAEAPEYAKAFFGIFGYSSCVIGRIGEGA